MNPCAVSDITHPVTQTFIQQALFEFQAPDVQFMISRLNTAGTQDAWQTIRESLGSRLYELGLSLREDFSVGPPDPRTQMMPSADSLPERYARHLMEMATLMQSLRPGRMSAAGTRVWLERFAGMVVSST